MFQVILVVFSTGFTVISTRERDISQVSSSRIKSNMCTWYAKFTNAVYWLLLGDSPRKDASRDVAQAAKQAREYPNDCYSQSPWRAIVASGLNSESLIVASRSNRQFATLNLPLMQDFFEQFIMQLQLYALRMVKASRKS